MMRDTATQPHALEFSKIAVQPPKRSHHAHRDRVHYDEKMPPAMTTLLHPLACHR